MSDDIPPPRFNNRRGFSYLFEKKTKKTFGKKFPHWTILRKIPREIECFTNYDGFGKATKRGMLKAPPANLRVYIYRYYNRDPKEGL